MLTGTLEVITQVAMLVFVVGGMAAMGLGLTLARITEPLRDLRLVVALLIPVVLIVLAGPIGKRAAAAIPAAAPSTGPS